MQTQAHSLTMFVALAIGACAFNFTPALAIPTAQDQDHHQKDQYQNHRNEHTEYLNNKYYQLGNKEGYEDHKKNLQRKEHNHAYKNDLDRQAHDYGYQQGWHGQEYREHERPN